MILPQLTGHISHALLLASDNEQARRRFRYTYEYMPIILKNGIASGKTNDMMTILDLTTENGYPQDKHNYFGYFNYVSGGTYMQNTVALYPFANQYTAANAIIRQPITASLLMTCPARSTMPMDIRQGIFTSLMASIDKHISLGGMFVVYTPMSILDNCLLVSVRDASSGDNAQLQNAIIWDFQQPQILEEEDARQATNATMRKIDKGEKW